MPQVETRIVDAIPQNPQRHSPYLTTLVYSTVKATMKHDTLMQAIAVTTNKTS